MPRKTNRTKITSPEKTAQINKSNMRLKNDFLLYLKSIQRSAGTIAGYDSDLLIVFTYMLDNLDNKDFHKLTKRDIIALQNWLVDNGNSPARIRRIKSAISSLSNYIENILADEEPEYKDYRPIVRKIESPVNQPVREKTIFTDEQLTELLDKLTEAGRYDQACAVALAMYGGRRKSELLRFKADWFVPENIIFGALYKTPEEVRTKGAGTGKYIYCYTLVKGFDPYYKKFMEWREANGIESEWLFYDKVDPTKPMNVATLNSWAKIFSRILGVPFYWHALRHYFTTMLSKSGLPDSVIQTVIGWSSADMVRLYDDTSADEQIGQFFDEGGIKQDIKPTSFADV